MSPHSRKRTALALGAVTIALLSADSARADYTAEVQGGTLTLTGDAASEELVLRLAPGAPGTLEADVGGDGTADHSFDRATFTTIDVLARGGDDQVRVDQQSGAFTDEFLTIDGGSGADTLIGGAGAETLLGGAGNDEVDGNTGTDVARLGAGSDRFRWDPGDGSDTVEGDDGSDLLDFNASNAPENVDVSANGARVRLTRNVANVVIDLDEIERASVEALGGSDAVAVGDLSGTDLETADVDLGADGQPDAVTALGTGGADAVELASDSGAVVVSGLRAQLRVVGGELADDVTVDGGLGEDSATYGGTAAPDEFNVVANGGEVRTNAPGVAVDTLAIEDVVLEGRSGADTMTAVGNLAALTRLTMDGAGGHDSLSGSNGADRLLAGGGNDHVDGQQGTDTALLGSGSDTFQWDPGDGSDTVEGESGSDSLRFNGSGIGESVEASANGERVRLTRNIANIVMDLDGVEGLDLHPVGGGDTAIVGDVAGTDLETVDVDLAAAGGGGDAAVDTVIARGTDAADALSVGESGAVEGLSATTRIVAGAETQDDLVVQALGGADELSGGVGVPGPATVNLDGGDGADTATYGGTAEDDQIHAVANGPEASVVSPATARFDTAAVEEVVLEGLGGGDTMTAVGNLAALTHLTFDGDGGNDTLLGSNGPDALLAGPGDDLVDGQQGSDTALLGSGRDTFQWDPGDGNDTVEGQGGSDAMAFNGSNIGEIFDVSANGDRVRFTRDIANIAMDLAGVERIGLRALGGSDTATVNDLTGTDMDAVDVDLSLSDGTSDPQPDTVVVNGTEERDVVRLTRSGDQVLASGLAAQTRIAGSQLLSDTLRVQTLGGDDAVTVSPAVEELITPVIALGADE
jgi:Ca2+-binding RTX toxin-like protein